MTAESVLHVLSIAVFARFVVGAFMIFTPDPDGGPPSPFALPMGVSFWGMVALTYRTALGPLWTVAAGAAGLLVSWALFEWAAASIRGRLFSYAFANDTPRFLHTGGPYRYIRNPCYASYLLALVSVALIWPGLIAAALALGMLGYFVVLAQFEERKFEASELREEYAAYRRHTGRLLPRL